MSYQLWAAGLKVLPMASYPFLCFCDEFIVFWELAKEKFGGDKRISVVLNVPSGWC
jgi:hypothetical protein